MNWRLSDLDSFSLVSNSDSHSPSRIGREANVFDCELNFWEIKKVLKERDRDKFLYTVEFFPEEGKYHYDGHRNCQIRLHPQETKKYNGLCPACKRSLTRGVLYRVEELADRPQGFEPQNAIGYKAVVPFDEIVAEVKGVGRTSKAVSREYFEIVSQFDSEFSLMLKVPSDELYAKLSPKIAEGIMNVRNKNVVALPGYDGEYGVIKIFQEQEEKKQDQLSLF